MKKITLSNDFHSTEITLQIKESGGAAIGTLSAGQVKKARRALCGISGCTCGDDLGRRGSQENEIEPIIDNRSGQIIGARVYARR
jgi:hypothetical protein